MKSFLLALLVMGLVASCGESESINKETTLKGDNHLLAEADALQEAITRGRILGLSSGRDRSGVQGSLQDARHALVRLAKNPDDKIGIELGFRAIKELERYIIVRGDRAVIENFYNQLGVLVTEAAQRNGIKVENIDWRQFIYNFSDGVEPFATVGTSSEWATGISLDESYIRVRGPQNKAWLISPSFDLTKMVNPSFRIVHQTSVDRDDRSTDEFNRVLINNRVFKAYVSTDYQDGDVNNATWTEVNLGKLPSSVDFHSVESAKVDLTPFISKNTTVALVLDADPRVVGRHYLTWQISRFEIFGAGDLGAVTARAGILHEHLFNKSELSPFQEVMTVAESPRWEPFGFSGNFKFAKIEAYGKAGENWLISPKYILQNLESVKLTVKETVRNPIFDKMKILISTNYNGQNPDEATWVEVKRAAFEPTPEKWEDITTGPYDLSAFKGKEIVVGFKYSSDLNDKSGWEISSIAFTGKGDKIKVRQYPVTFKLPGSDDSSSGNELLVSYNFNLGAEGFTTEVVSGDPAEWVLKSRNGAQYQNISGNVKKNVGTTRLVSPKFKVDGKSGVTVKQAINFYPEASHAKKMIRTLLSDEVSETEIKFEKAPFGNNWNIVDSEVYEIPEELVGKDLRLIFEYTSGEDNVFPNWDIHQAQIFKIKE